MHLNLEIKANLKIKLWFLTVELCQRNHTVASNQIKYLHKNLHSPANMLNLCCCLSLFEMVFRWYSIAPKLYSIAPKFGRSDVCHRVGLVVKIVHSNSDARVLSIGGSALKIYGSVWMMIGGSTPMMIGGLQPINWIFDPFLATLEQLDQGKTPALLKYSFVINKVAIPNNLFWFLFHKIVMLQKNNLQDHLKKLCNKEIHKNYVRI